MLHGIMQVRQNQPALGTDEHLHKPAAHAALLPAGELRLVGVKQPEKIAQVSVRNDAAFLFSVVMSTSVIALVLGQLPGDWGFFSSYLAGGRPQALRHKGVRNGGTHMCTGTVVVQCGSMAGWPAS